MTTTCYLQFPRFVEYSAKKKEASRREASKLLFLLHKQFFFSLFCVRFFKFPSKKKIRQANKKTDREEKKRKKSNFIISAATCVRQREKVQRTISRLLLNMKKKRFVRVILNIASHIAIYFSSALLFLRIFFFLLSLRPRSQSQARPAKFRTNTRMISDATRDDFFSSSLFLPPLGLSRVIIENVVARGRPYLNSSQSTSV
jgi:hypothetical protein